MAKKTHASSVVSSDQIGRVLYPLRLFVGITFIYAGLQKFFSADYFSTTSPNGFLKQTISASTKSPISFILNHAIEHHTLVAFGVASGELLAGLGLLLGIWTRVSALGVFGLATSFFLTVSWGTSPYYFGPDIVFMAAATPFLIAGDGGFMSLGYRIRESVRREFGVAPNQAVSNNPLEEQIERRTLVKTGALAGGVGVAGLAVGLVGKSRAKSSVVATPSTSPSATPTSSATSPASGTKVATVADVPVGSAFQFTDPTGNPGYLMQPKAGTYLAYSAICTHQGCVVSFDSAGGSFQCPCHGAQFDATGTATRGPARDPLQAFSVTVSGSDIFIA